MINSQDSILQHSGQKTYKIDLNVLCQVADNEFALFQLMLKNVNNQSNRVLSPFFTTQSTKNKQMVLIDESLYLVTLITVASLIQYMSLKGIYAFFGSTTLMGILFTRYLLQNSILDQLRDQQIPDQIARELAIWMGQTLQSNPDLTLSGRLSKLNRQQIYAMSVASFNYITTFGVLLAMTSTGTLTLSRRGISPQLATYYTAAISELFSLSRTLMSFHPFHVDSSVITNVGFLVMIPSSLIFALNNDQSVWLPMLLLFSIANGISNYGVDQTTTSNAYILAAAFCGASLFLNLLHEYHRRQKFTPIPSRFIRPLNEDMEEQQSIEVVEPTFYRPFSYVRF